MKSLKEKHLTALDTKDFYQSQMPSLTDKIRSDQTGAFWHTDEYLSLMSAEAERLDRAKTGALYGLTFGAKDLFCIESHTTTAGSKILEGFRPQYTATLVESLMRQGALLCGKLAMDEFAMGSYTNTSYLGRVSMPGDPSRTAGGSSGGSAAAIPLLDFTLGSDTGGSIRQPAAFCGVVGYKPSYGTFSRYGMISYASSLDQAGICTRTVEDLKYLMSLDYSQDPKDRTSTGLKKMKREKTGVVGYLPDLLESPGLSEEVKRMYQSQIPSGAKAYQLKYMKYAAQIYYIIACAEAASNLARYQGVFFGPKLQPGGGTYWQQVAEHRSLHFGPEVKKRIMLGSYITSSENFQTMYRKSLSLRAALTQEIKNCLAEVDYLMLPTTVSAAPQWDSIAGMSSAEIYMADVLTVPFSLAGVAALSVPVPQSPSTSLPLGLQLVGLDDLSLIKHAGDTYK